MQNRKLNALGLTSLNDGAADYNTQHIILSAQDGVNPVLDDSLNRFAGPVLRDP